MDDPNGSSCLIGLHLCTILYIFIYDNFYNLIYMWMKDVFRSQIPSALDTQHDSTALMAICTWLDKYVCTVDILVINNINIISVGVMEFSHFPGNPSNIRQL